MKPDFLNALLKEQDGFLQYVKFLINYETKNWRIVTSKTERKIKEKLKTRFDYNFWECCLLYLVV